MSFFKNYDSFVITILGVILILLSLIVYFIESNIIAISFLIGFGIGWILLGLKIKNYKIEEEE